MAGPSRELISAQKRSEQIVRRAERARQLAAGALADNSKRAYKADWADFSGWCADNGVEALPASAETLASYLVTLADSQAKASTIERRIAAIASAHKLAGVPDVTKVETVKLVWAGIRREIGTRQDQASPITVEVLRSMLGQSHAGLRGARDRALLLVGFAGALRRSELVAIDLEDCEFSEEGVVIVKRRSKTDQEGHGFQVVIPRGQHAETCPVSALETHLQASRIRRGPVFRRIDRFDRVGERLTAASVNTIVKDHVRRAGYDDQLYSAHSLRAGLATAAAAAGVDERTIMDQTGHKSLEQVRGYIRLGRRWGDNAAGSIGL